MGNIGSQQGQIQRPPSEEQQWAHSFPRTQPRVYQPKVLPERDARQKLRHTNNGEILQSGGTLSGRQHPNRRSLREGVVSQEKPDKSRTYLPNQRDPLHKSGLRYAHIDQNGAFKQNMKKFGSEPDLREAKSLKPQVRLKMKKKYKAPPPPPTFQMDWDENSSGENEPLRHTRLFKTQAETKKSYSSPVHNHNSLDKEDALEMRERDPSIDLLQNRLSHPKTITSNFRQELKEVTTRLRTTRAATDTAHDNKEKLKTLDHNIHKKENIRQRLKEVKTVEETCREEGSGKESSSPEQLIRKEQPKPFYFGMDDQVQNDEYQNDLIDNFALNLHTMTQMQKIPNSSESDISSEIEVDEHYSDSQNGIDLQLRPILPKKQLEIPKFSPAAAWRLLSGVDSNANVSTISSNDIPSFLEEKIEKFSRPPPPTVHVGPRSNDKSGDSGISGDAGPTGYDDSPDIITNSRNSLVISQNQEMSWTPQQDLGEDSSIEEGLNNENYKPKFRNNPQVFSLSLPRDNHLAAYMSDKIALSGLQKLKRSVSGVLGSLGNKKDFLPLNLSEDQGDNWFLSKSAPNSLNNGFNSLEMKPLIKSEDKDVLLMPSSKGCGRLMYLPQFDTNYKGKEKMRDRSKSADCTTAEYKIATYSKSMENLHLDHKSDLEPEDLQDPPKWFDNSKHWARKPKRFTFQSTVRQIERKRLADKLSKEAEKKEKQRLRELEAMQKVEEEFQKKRAREKANIRQQLQMFSINDVSWTGKSPDGKPDVRPEPDGAVSSSPASSPVHKVETRKVYQKNKKTAPKHRPSSDSSDDTKVKAPVTQILSEYRHPQREYKDYMSSKLDVNFTKTTIHPQVTCNMPNAKQGSKATGANYRKDFAHGVKSTKLTESTYSEDSQSRNNSPKMYHNKYAPMTR